jgi:hypothetical protein
MQLQLLYVVRGSVPRWCQKPAWVSPARPRPPSDSKVIHWLKGGEWALLSAIPNPAAQQIMVLLLGGSITTNTRR